MYIVKLSLSVNGLPSAATRGYTRYDFVEQRVCAASYTRHYYFDYDNN